MTDITFMLHCLCIESVVTSKFVESKMVVAVDIFKDISDTIHLPSIIISQSDTQCFNFGLEPIHILWHTA